MIKRLKYHEIDFEKYDKCIENSVQRKYSADKLFLDITTKKKWDLLIYNDYEAIMPVPFVRKFGIKFVMQPKLCQQLGIFSNVDLENINNLFREYLEKNYNVINYHFNDKNQFTNSILKRKNFLFPPTPYEKVYQQFSPKRKRKLRLNEEVEKFSEVREIKNLNEVKLFIKKHAKGMNKKKDQEEFYKIYNHFFQKERLNLLGFYYRNKLINLIVLYEDFYTIALLGTFNDNNFVKLSGASILINEALKKYVSTKIFDFEGGNLPNIEEFFRGFRPDLREYASIGNNKKELFIKIFIR